MRRLVVVMVSAMALATALPASAIEHGDWVSCSDGPEIWVVIEESQQELISDDRQVLVRHHATRTYYDDDTQEDLIFRFETSSVDRFVASEPPVSTRAGTDLTEDTMTAGRSVVNEGDGSKVFYGHELQHPDDLACSLAVG